MSLMRNLAWRWSWDYTGEMEAFEVVLLVKVWQWTLMRLQMMKWRLLRLQLMKWRFLRWCCWWTFSSGHWWGCRWWNGGFWGCSWGNGGFWGCAADKDLAVDIEELQMMKWRLLRLQLKNGFFWGGCCWWNSGIDAVEKWRLLRRLLLMLEADLRLYQEPGLVRK